MDDNEPMNQDLPLANIITLGVADVAGQREFYRRLGWPLVWIPMISSCSSFAGHCSRCSASTT
jgi:hypothetical protein